jgi:hypothetical protein
MSRSKPVFHLAARSGLIAAATSADTVLFAWRNPSATAYQFLHKLEILAETVTGFSAAFENALDVLDVSSFAGANYTGGTDLSHPTTAANHAYSRISVDALSRPKQETVLDTGNVRIATTTGLSHAGSPVIASHPFAFGAVGELATGAAVAKGAQRILWEAAVVDDVRVPRALLPDAGFIIRNPVALAAAGTLRIWVSVLWSEKN